jgi:hypothetical protein
MFFHQLAREPFVRCETGYCVAQVSMDNRSDTFSGDGAVVSNN